MKVLGSVIKSASDKRTYKAIQLANELECLLVSDEEAQKSSAALSVGIGSLLDPMQAQGLAHYLEHMLFMGTEKYPEENDYMNYIAKNQGSSNAYTSQEETNFHFEVASSAFVNTMDRFAQFFICPLMLESSSERQLNAVHSQHSKNLQNDMWRKFQLTKHLAKAGHPYSKFSTGDKNSLANPDLRKMLFDFYNSHYSSNLMKMVVYGKQNVDELGQMVQRQFSAIPNKSYKSYQMTQQPYDEKKMFKKIIKIVPVKDKRTLQLTWILKDKAMHYRSAPSRYVSHILGHEGKGSLLSYLISQGLANSLSAGGNDHFDCYSEFEISLSLTDKGFDNIERVIGHVLHAVESLKRQQPQRWVIEQIQHINKMKFDFMEKRQGISFVSGIAKRMHKRSVQQILYYPYLMEEWRPDLIKEYLNQIGTQNLMIICQNQKYQPQCSQVEPIYKTKFTTKDIGNIQPQPCAFHLPQKNIFIPQDLTILPLGTAQYPILLTAQQSQVIEPFYKKDHRFNLPKAEVNLRIYFDGQSTVKQDVCRRLFEQMLKESLREFAYMAQTAELHSEVSFGNFYSLNIKVVGFRDSFTSFMHQYVNNILSFIPTDKALFETLKQKQIKSYSNALLGNPYQLAYDALTTSLREGSGNLTQKKLLAIPNVNFNDIFDYANYWRQKVYSELLISGNMDQGTAVSITRNIQETLKKYSQTLKRQEISSIRAIFLPSTQTSVVEETLTSKQDNNCSVIIHYQYEAFQVRTKILQDLAQAFIKEPAFDYLRTKQQLGYIVMSLPDDNRGVLGMSILVQSSIKNSHQLTGYIDFFIQKVMKNNIQQLTEQVFAQYRSALLSTRTQKDKNLGEQCGRFWAQIVKHAYLFDRKQQQIDLLPTITLQEFKNFLNFLFFTSPRRFQIHEVAQSLVAANQETKKARLSADPNIKVYNDIVAFRKKMQLYPDYYSHL